MKILPYILPQRGIVKKHYKSGNMQRLQREYKKKDVVWFRICSSAPGLQGNQRAVQITELDVDEEEAQPPLLY